MLNLSILRPHIPLNDCNAVTLETIELGGKTLQNYGFNRDPQSIRCKLPTHECVTTCYGKSFKRMAGYLHRIGT